MSFASDRLYNVYMRRRMPIIASNVKVREIIPHLPCLTLTDREEIEAKREMYGNYNAMQYLLECLRRREDWAEEFIRALEACEHTTMAAEIRAEYDSLRGTTDNPHPGSPSANVVMAHVHPAPSASPLSSPEIGGSSLAAVAPPQPTAQASPPPEAPMQPEAPPSPVVQVPRAASPPEPVPEPSKSPLAPVASPPSTPPPSPVTPRQAATPPPPVREENVHQEPEENSESDIRDVSRDEDVIPDEDDEGDSNVSEPSHPVEQCEPDAPSCPDPPQTTTEVRASPSHSPAQANPEGTVEPSYTSPVQDTAPPVDKVLAVVLQPEETSEPAATQVIENGQQTEDTETTSHLTGAALMDTSVCDDNTMCLSKPGELVSINAQDHQSPTIPALDLPQEPYSGNTDRLEVSNAVLADPESSDYITSCSADDPTIISTVSPPPCEGNGFAVEHLNHNEPEENHYESLSPSSLGNQEVRMHVVEVAEEPSILNQDGQSLTPQAQIVNGEAAEERASPPSTYTTAAADSVSNSNACFAENCHPSDSAPADYIPELKTLDNPEEKSPPHTLSLNTKYVLTAAGVGVCALLMALKFKNKQPFT